MHAYTFAHTEISIDNTNKPMWQHEGFYTVLKLNGYDNVKSFVGLPTPTNRVSFLYASTQFSFSTLLNEQHNTKHFFVSFYILRSVCLLTILSTAVKGVDCYTTIPELAYCQYCVLDRYHLYSTHEKKKNTSKFSSDITPSFDQQLFSNSIIPAPFKS